MSAADMTGPGLVVGAQGLTTGWSGATTVPTAVMTGPGSVVGAQGVTTDWSGAALNGIADEAGWAGKGSKGDNDDTPREDLSVADGAAGGPANAAGNTRGVCAR